MKTISLLGLGNIGKTFIKTKNINLKNVVVRNIKKNDIIFIKRLLIKKVLISKNIKYAKSKIYIETIGGEKVISIIKKIPNNMKIITANKNMLALYNDIRGISKKKKLFIEPSVGGGMPIINIVQKLKIKFEKIITIINGTTNYILTCIFKNINYKKTCELAIKKGLSEKNIDFDLKGTDIVYKLNILINIVYGLKIKNKEIFREILKIPKKTIIRLLKKNSFVIKYLAKIKKKKRIIAASIYPIIIKENSCYNIKYENNFIHMFSKKYGNIFLKAKGAGKFSTVSSILSDIENKNNVIFKKKKKNIIQIE
ncbi:hypothetical protein ACWNYO_00545 [Candidatus Vidania fulgoroideorum]